LKISYVFLHFKFLIEFLKMNQNLEKVTAKLIITGLILVGILAGISSYFMGSRDGYYTGYDKAYTIGYNDGLDDNYAQAKRSLIQRDALRSIAEKIIKDRQESNFRKSLEGLITNTSKLLFGK